MGIKEKLIESQKDIAERVQNLLSTVNGKEMKKAKIQDTYSKIEKYRKEFELNHAKLQTAGVDNSDYFSSTMYEDTLKLMKKITNSLVSTSNSQADLDSSVAEMHDELSVHSVKKESEAEEIENWCTFLLKDLANNQNGKISGGVKNRLENLFGRIDKMYNNYTKFNPNLNETYLETSNRYYEAVTRFVDSTEKTEENLDINHHHHINMELEKLKIPMFYGDVREWPTFHNLFKDMVHENNRIPNTEKMLRLRTSLKGEAARLIQHLQISSTNYAAAWMLLKNRYENKRILFTAQWDRLLDQPEINSENAESVRQLLDTTNECLNAIEALGITIDQNDPFIGRIIVRKLDKGGIKLYEQIVQKPREIQTLADVLQFLDQLFQTLTAVAEKPAAFQNKRIQKQHASNHLNIQQRKKCGYCSYTSHGITECYKFLALKPEDRLKWARDQKICLKCLKHKWSEACNQKELRCKICSNAHNDLIHVVSIKENTKPTAMTTHSFSTVILATAQIRAKAINGEYILLRALIDQGSQISSISEEAAQLLNLPRKRHETRIHGLGESLVGESKYRIKVEIKPRFLNDYKEEIDAVVLSTLTSAQPDQSFDYDINKWKNQTLADPMFNKSDRIDMVLGGDLYGRILENGVKKMNGVLGQATKFGWILSGIVKPSITKKVTSAVTNLDRFWELEEIDDQDSNEDEQQTCMEKYNNSVKRDNDGKFIVEVPFKEDMELGESRKLAAARLISMERKFAKDKHLHEKYAEFINEYISLGHMMKVTDGSMGKYYLPHQAVIREDSATTKLRVVFDASAKSSNGKSLNDVMYTGPRLQKDIFDIISKWRLWKIVITADVEKMYRQIKISPEDRAYHRVLWRSNPQIPIDEYELTTVTYGTSSAPFLAVRTLMEMANRCPDPTLQTIIMEDFYMDDLMTGADSIEKGQQIQSSIAEYLKSFGFHLRKWLSNHEQVTDRIDGSIDNEVIEIKDQEAVKTLGLRWNPKEDAFMFKVNMNNAETHTKRMVLSQIARIFDPIGWLSPVTVTAKLFMQKLWMLNTTWDEKLSNDLEKEWRRFSDNIRGLVELRIPRWLHTFENASIQLHGFGDASEKAYAAVVYIKTDNEVQLLAAKTKVNPIKNRKTLPKLELCAAHLLAKLMNKVSKAISRPCEMYAWSDSTITLAWILNEKNKEKFVRSRVDDIKKYLPEVTWQHVNTKDNPADVASRGIDANKFLNFNLWWNGPNWLRQQPEQWPRTSIDSTLITTSLMMTKQAKQNEFADNLIHRFSSWLRLKRVVAYMLRFSSKTTKSNYLTSTELQGAAMLVINLSQKNYFRDEINLLMKDEPVQNTSKIRNLNPILDQDGILRVGGRLTNSGLPYASKHPIILMRSQLTKLIISDAHHSSLHGGNRLVEAIIRRQYWIVGLKNEVKSLIRSCTKCIRYRQTTSRQLMGNLPAERITESSAFTYTGVDYAGPFLMRCSKGRGQKAFKGYVALFVCLSTKAIHLEAVSDLSTEAFLAALRRFMARRGKCAHIYSDNGTNFVGARRLLDAEFKKAIKKNADVAPILANEHITWHFTPPAGPHFGGIWEAGVKAMKYHLRRAIGEVKLTFEEMSTVLSQIEASLNSRPLYAIDDDNGEDALTPGHFLIGKPLLSIPSAEEDIPVTSLNKWKVIQKIQRDFWKRWKDEYLHTLQQRNKWTIPSENLQEGDVVLIKNEDTHPSRWPMAKITQTHPGQDGRVRVVSLQLENSTLKRPIQKICPLLKIQDEGKEISARGTLKTTRNTIKTNMFGAFLMVLFMMPICYPASALGETIQNDLISELSEKAAIYLDPLGKVDVVDSKWNLVIYFDMNPLLDISGRMNVILHQLNTICPKLDLFEKDCNNVLNHMERQILNIEATNKNMFGHSLPRQKRAPFEFIGSFHHILFGLMDAEDRNIMEDNMRKILDNQHDINKLAKKQTSVMESSLNVLARTTKEVNEQFVEIQKHVTNLTQNIQENFFVYRESMRFFMLVTQLNMVLAENERIQADIVALLIDINHGKLNPDLISPAQMNTEIHKIREHLPEKYKLPGKGSSEIQAIYNSLSANGAIVDDKLVIMVNIPLINSQSSQLYKVVPIPFETHNHIMIPAVRELYLIYNFMLDSYHMMSEAAINKCKKLDDDEIMCDGNWAWTNGNDHSCEMAPLKPQSSYHCTFEEASSHPIWVKLKKENKWLFKVFNKTSAQIVCQGNRHVLVDLPFQGIMLLEPGCTVRSQGNTLFSPQYIKSESLKTIDLPLTKEIAEISKMTLKPLGIRVINNTKEIDQLQKEIAELKKQEVHLRDLNFHYQSFHRHTGPLSLGLILITGIIALILYLKIKCKSRDTVIIRIPDCGQDV